MKLNVAMRVPLGILVCVILVTVNNCFAASNVCASCGQYSNGRVYLIRDRVEGEFKSICETCAFLKRRCSLCQLPVKDNYTALPDGRYLCARDAPTAVLNVNAGVIFALFDGEEWGLLGSRAAVKTLSARYDIDDVNKNVSRAEYRKVAAVVGHGNECGLAARNHR